MTNSVTQDVARLLPWPAPDTNKYSRGRVIIVGGSDSFPGAVALAVLAAQRSGAGYVEAYVAKAGVHVVRSAALSAVVRAWDAIDFSHIPKNREDKPCAYVVGSGFCTTDERAAKLTQSSYKIEAPLLFDGGALTYVAGEEAALAFAWRKERGLATVLSPHAGEAARLARPFALRETDEAGLCIALAQAYQATCMLKGPRTYISNGEDVYCMQDGTAALAKAGTGDVLAGIAGAFLAQGMRSQDACVLAASLHAQAGRLAAERLSAISVIPEDIITYLPQAILSISNGRVE